MMKGIVEYFGMSFLVKALVVFSLVTVLPPGVYCAEKARGLATDKMLNTDSPLHIASDRMEVRQSDRSIVFEGHVVVQQDDLTITGNRLRVTATPGTKPNQPSIVDRIDRIEVEGDVRVAQRDKIATADRAVYYHQEQKIVLMGNPTVSQGHDKIQGRLITLYIDQGRSVVEGGEQTPVKAVLHPSRKD
ncbi:MAG: lipopolysaccharide transport periplasmic protein LptA [Syntrophobacteraceae bacterium]|nr:lipopolysaccharide transport periplasmic protein LptA [Syntrophobacteraceae bacterium]